MRERRVREFARRAATPSTRQGNALGGVRRPQRRIWPILTVLRRVERLVEAEERQEREENGYSMTWEGDEPNA